MGDLLFPEPAPRQATDCHVHLAGLGRTGTTSLVAAMRQLGYHVLHDDETGQEADLFKALYADPASTTDKLTEFHSQLGARGFNASAYGFLYFDWAAKQPSSKIILTVRDPDTWAASWQSITHLYDLMQERPFTWIPALIDLRPLQVDIFEHSVTGGHPEGYNDLQTLREGYIKHVDRVKRAVAAHGSADQLLVFSVKDGWEPLCTFLGIPAEDIPSTPFPHVNDRVQIQATGLVFVAVYWSWPFLLALPVLVPICCLQRCYANSKRQDMSFLTKKMD